MSRRRVVGQRFAHWIIAAALACGGSTADAAIVTYAFTGTVTLGDSLGEQLAGTFSYDTATPGSGHYPSSELFHFALDTRTGLTAQVDHIDILNNDLSGPDDIGLGVPLPLGQGSFPTGFGLFMEFRDSTHAALTSNALTETLPPVSAFDSASFGLNEYISGIQIGFTRGTIDSLIRVVDAELPEPSALLVLLAGIGAVLTWPRRRGRTLSG